MGIRQYARFDLTQEIGWDYFSERTGLKKAIASNISQAGCLIESEDSIEEKRWIRIVLLNRKTNISYTLVGRAVRTGWTEDADSPEVHFAGIQFTFPGTGILPLQDLDLILALSSRNLTARSCLIRNIKSSFRPGSLA